MKSIGTLEKSHMFSKSVTPELQAPLQAHTNFRNGGISFFLRRNCQFPQESQIWILELLIALPN